jgi:predicted ester cyclase
LCDKDKVVVRWTAYDKHTGPLAGEKPTGIDIILPVTGIYPIQNNKVVADWATADDFGFVIQLGILDPKDLKSKPMDTNKHLK